CQVALGQLDGKLSKRIHTFSDSIKHALALMEAHIDFPDDEVGSLNLSSLNQNISTLSDEIACLAASFDTGRVLREGVNVLILGRPNVGKSSLMNALLGESRAIVTEIAGTTRDTLEEQLVLAGFPIRLIDAAGVRETDDPIEREGVRRAQEKAQSADLTLLVVDGSVPLEQEDELAAQICDADKTILVLNKSDQGLLPTSAALTRFETRVEVSAKHGAGLDDLQATLERHLQGSLPGDAAEDLIVNERRHCDALLQAVQALRLFRDGVALSAPYECLALELRSALDALGLITGETTPDDILNQIFSQFCIGK
ncbi:MAG: 50S ribosome-binding GTPase, partial [Desulfuromonadales bacterium]|nr:50S ribosome-binding GTPase [Desulfuromonadales bacterium]